MTGRGKYMAEACRMVIILTFTQSFITHCDAQNETGRELLILHQTISLPDVKGRIDHIDINVKDQLAYIAALGNNTLEIIDLKNGQVAGSIKGLNEPQGVAYITKHQEIFVANGGTGQCDFFNALTLRKTGSIKLSDDADDVRYDPFSDKIYVGYGSGGIAVIDGASRKQIGDIPLPSHPESFQLDAKVGKLWVNLPASNMVGVVDLTQLKLSGKWSKSLPRSNFPMAYDHRQKRLIVAYRTPAKLIVYNSETGAEIFSAPIVDDADDVYWEKDQQCIYVSGGGGAINVFNQVGPAVYKQIAYIKTREGARTSLLVPELGLLLIAAKANGDQQAALLVYRTHIDL